MSIGGGIRRTVYWTNDCLHGSPVGRHIHEIRKVLNNYDGGVIIQNQSLDKLLHFACDHTLFYRGINPKSIKNFPVVNKNILINNYKEIAVNPSEIPEQKTEGVHIQKTSGSTGTPFAVPQDTRKRNRRVAELKYFGEIGGFKSHEKLGQCRVWTKWQSKSRCQQFTENILAVNISKMDESTVRGLIETAQKKKVVALLGYANWFDQVALYLSQHPTKLPSLKVIFTGSEMLKEQTRTELKRLIGCHVLERYSNEEQGILGQQSIYGGIEYYLNHASYYFEVLKLDEDVPAENGELGRIVITDLYNYAFPLIRYDTGDTGILSKGNGISKGWPYISKLYGRRLDLIFDTSGNPVQPMALARVLKNLKGIIQWQFVQTAEREYKIRLNMEKEISVDACINELLEILGKDAIIAVDLVDEIPVLASGKRKPVVNEWNK
jgi:phenylacetate-CoA ligase